MYDKCMHEKNLGMDALGKSYITDNLVFQYLKCRLKAPKVVSNIRSNLSKHQEHLNLFGS
jgi:hypothetical protein